jgi:hypothetical protein
VIVAGSLSFYAGVLIEEQRGQSLVNDAANATKNPLQVAVPEASNLALVQPAQLIPSGATSFKTTEVNAQFIAAPQLIAPTSAQTPVLMSQEMMAQIELPASFVPNNPESTAEAAPFAHINLKQFSSGSQAIALLGDDLTAVAKWYGMSKESFQNLLLSDASVHLDRKGRMLHIDSGLVPGIPVGTAAGGKMEATTAVAPATIATASSPFPLDQTFKLHTKPNSTRLLYLNFTGEGKNPAFSLDAVPSTFSDAERILIQKVWLRVAEDYAPFDVDITTEKPAIPTGKIGATILITPQTNTAGGYAYLNSFSTFAAGAAPAFCFPNNLANSEKPIAECVSHELGHTLGLTHQGTTSVAYYQGQGDGETGWAPIMGVGYYKNLTQWSKGEYAKANNKQDAYAVMLKQGLKIATDDHGNTPANADNLVSKSANGYNNFDAIGVIEMPGDIDMFRFVAGAGTASFTVGGAALGGNLDISLQLIDSAGKVLATSNADATLASTISFVLPVQGTYFLSVTGAGKGSALVTGYSNYGSLGQYVVSGKTALSSGGTGVVAPPPPATVTPPAPVPAPTPAADVRSVTVTFDARGASVAGATIKTYLWNFGDGTATANTALVSHIYTKAGVYQASLSVLDSLGRRFSATMQVTIK